VIHKEKYFYNIEVKTMNYQWLWIIVPILIVDIYCLVTIPKFSYNYGYKELTDDDLELLRLNLLYMDGREFEIFCSKLFELLGYKVELTKTTNDGGKDIVLKDKNKELIYVECKRYDEYIKIGRPMLQKLAGSMFSDGVRKGIFITTSSYNKNAMEYAKKTRLELWDMTDIINLIVKLNQEKVPNLISKLFGFNFINTENQIIQS
jgi:restriction endonuclease Mrr